MGLVRLALGNVYGVVVSALLIVVIGTVAVVSIPVDILPAFKTPAVQVLTYFNGMPARSVERTITDRIERWVNQAPGVRDVESRSVVGVSVVKLYFRDEVDPNSALTMTNSLSLAAQPYLPTNTLPPVVLPFDPTGTLPLGILTVSNPSLSEASVKDVARVEVRNALGSVSGCVVPVVVGGKDRRVMIYLDPKRVEARNLSPVDVVRALDLGNMMVTPGTAYFGDNQIALDTNVMVREIDELNDMPISFAEGRQVLLRDVGRAEDGSVIQKSRVRVNGRRQVFVPVYRQAGASSLDVTAGVKEAIPRIEEQLGNGTKLDFVIDQSEYVRKAIHSLIEEGIVGAVLVAVMILVFLGDLRMTFVAVVALPLAVLCSLVGLKASGNTVNVMTLAGLFLAIGPLIDNAIVVLENTHRHLGTGKNPVRAAYDAASELALPVLLATLATIIVLVPLALTPGVSGFLFKPLTMAVAFAMVASYFLAMTFVPALCSKLLKPHAHDDGHRRRSAFERAYGVVTAGLDWLNRRYEGALGAALRFRRTFLAGVVALFAASLTLLAGIGQEYFPQVDAGQITMAVRAPSNLRLDANEDRIIEVEKFLEEQIPPDERTMIVSEMGLNPDWSSAYTQNAGQQDTIIRIQLTEGRTLTAQQYAVKLRHAFAANPKFTDLQIAFDTGGMVTAALNFGASSPIDVALSGGTPEDRMAAARKVRAAVAALPGAADVRVLQRVDAPYLILDVDRQKSAAVGLTTRDVVMQVVTAMNSSIAMTRNFWIDPKSGNQYFVAVQYPEDPNFSVEDLQNVSATGTNRSTPVRLSSLVDIRPGTSEVELNHAGLRKVTNVLVNTEGRDIGGVASDIDARLKALTDLPKGVRVELKGEYGRMRESFQSLGGGMALASTLVYLLMVPLLRSFVGPLIIIMFTVPLGLIGVLATLYATGTTLNIQSEMGVIFLVGLSVSQGVLLLDFANQQRRDGYGVRDAVVRAATVRFRPILMTFLAAFLDLLPMAIGLGKGSEAITPLARAVVGGLVTSTGLMLFVVPVLYTLLIREGATPPADVDALINEPVPHAAH